MPQDDRGIVFFDIDNTLYSASTRISQAMGEKARTFSAANILSDIPKIHAYFVSLGLAEDEASRLHMQYYKQYGLALAGLVRHHQIDPLDFDRKCDGSLPLEDMIKPNPAIRVLLQDIDRSKVRVWALTNANRPHAERVLRILNLQDLIEDIVFCDYSQPDLVAKPNPEFYHRALQHAGIDDPTKCSFVDDSRVNVEAARALGWGKTVYFCELGLEHAEGGKVKEISRAADDDIVTIHDLEQLRIVWHEIFKQ